MNQFLRSKPVALCASGCQIQTAEWDLPKSNVLEEANSYVVLSNRQDCQIREGSLSKGFKTSRLSGAKSFTLRVSSVRPRLDAIEAMAKSAKPGEWLLALAVSSKYTSIPRLPSPQAESGLWAGCLRR